MKKFARIYLWITSVVYVLACGFYLTKALLTPNDEFLFPKSSAPMAEHVRILLWIGFPVFSMLALYIAWERYLRGRIQSSMIIAALPWMYGMGLLIAK